jgi:hypothetical protein
MEREDDMWPVRVDVHSVYIRVNANYDNAISVVLPIVYL